MFNIGSFFERFNAVAAKEIKTREIIARAIEKYTTANVDIKEIQFRNKIIHIRTNPGLKNQIFIKKEAILSEIRKEMPQAIVTDLR